MRGEFRDHTEKATFLYDVIKLTKVVMTELPYFPQKWLRQAENN